MAFVSLYVLCFGIALVCSALLTPLARTLAMRWGVYDHPNSQVKTHVQSTPYLGGLAIWAAFSVALVAMRFWTDFPTGTLYALRGILLGSVFVVILGLIDDLKPHGLSFQTKFLLQILTALILVTFDIRIKFIQPHYAAAALTLLWVVGVSNALNLIDIMDGLAASVAAAAAAAFLVIALPTEEIYVNFSAAALAGACLGFLPYNLSRGRKIFMGDTGSLFLGFVLAALSMGTSYTSINEAGLFAPILILGLPLYETIFVMIIRLRLGKSPFMGSKDHVPLRLEAMGHSRRSILGLAVTASLVLSACAYGATRLPLAGAVGVFLVVGAAALILSWHLSQVKMD